MDMPTDDSAITRRDWTLQVNIPAAHADPVMRSCLAGTVDLTLRGPHTNVLLCALPKSASLHVTQLLALSLGLKNHPVGFGNRGGRAYYPRLLLAKYQDAPTVSHCHNPPDPFTKQAVERLGLRPVVLTRNLLDALVSRRDMTVQARQASGMLSPKAFARFLDSSSDEQLDITIDLYGPTYINFAAAWFDHRNDPTLNPVFATFEEMKRDEVAMVLRIAAELGLPCERDRVVEASTRIKEAGGVHLSPKGKGRAGRGREQLSAAHLERLRKMALGFGCDDEEFLGFALDPAAASAA